MDVCSLLLADLRDCPRFTRDKERALFVRMQEHGDQDAREQLILSMCPRAKVLAVESCLPWEDAWSAAMLGVCVAVDSFSLAMDTLFTTYASYWMRSELSAAIPTGTCNVVAAPRYVVDGSRVGVRSTTQEAFARWHKGTVLLAPEDSCLACDGEQEKPLDIQEEMERLGAVIAQLSEQDQWVLFVRRAPGRTLKEIGRHYSEPHFERLYRRAIRRARKIVRGRGWRENGHNGHESVSPGTS